MHIQSSAWFHATTPLPDQETDTTWIGNSGQLMELDKPEHVRRRHGAGYYTPDASVARIIWEWDQEASRLASWQILLNTSLLDRLAPQDFQGLTPAYGDLAVLSVQDRNAAYTNGLVAVIPEPATMALLALGSIALLRRRR